MEKMIKALIWLYVVLLIFEGALRKWVLPSLSDPILIIRDPVAMAIYLLAFASGRFPLNGFVLATFALAAASAVASLIGGQTNLLVLAYGLRINYFHLPLMWVMANVLTRKDVEKLGSLLLLIAIPMTALMVFQFKSPMNAWINRGIGSEEGGQIFGAMGRIRPPGFFSFITGPQVFFPLVAAFFLNQASSGRRRLWWPFLIAAGLSVLIALPVSISRTVMLATGIVGGVFVLSMGRAGVSLGTHFKTLFTLGIVAAVVSFLPIFGEGREVFMSRWETAASGSDGDAWGSITSRVLSGFTQPLKSAAHAPFFGRGIGVGSNVGARLLSGKVGFLLAEDDWSKVFQELGPVLGAAFILFRIFIVLYMLWRSLQALYSRRDNLPILIWSACAFPIALSQWAPPTILGFVVIGGGLLLAALNTDEEDAGNDEELNGPTEDNPALAYEPYPEAPARVRY